jgi:ribonucleoside-diphosphate reductase alpha chain
MELTENALYLLKQRYLKKNEKRDIIETPEEMFRRVAKTIAEVEYQYNKGEEEVKELEDKFYNMMTTFKFLPNSPCLMNAGTNLGILSACFVLPIEDSLCSIMDGVKYSSIIHKNGGGTGFNFSNLRPKGDVVKSSGGIASGPVSFMKIYNAVTDVIKQGGRRRGANMGILHYWHPDILDFITCKEKEGNYSNFNISIGVDNKFMNAVINDKEIELINPRTKKPIREIRARSIWNLILIMAWRNGEPGVLFFDKINKYNPTPDFPITSVNPCGEQPLLDYESCNLGSINISKFIVEGRIQWKELEETVRLATRFLDNVIDANKFPIKQIEVQTKANRKIGLGIMGWHDFLILKRIRYDSEEALQLARNIMKFITETARDESRKLGKEKGNFPNKDISIYKHEKYMRNATVTTIAPTGSISIIANTSQGIEPLFALQYNRNVKDSLGKNLIEYSPIVASLLKEYNCRKITTLPEDIRSVLTTANEIDPIWHIRMQSAFQKYTDNAVSKTVNLPNSATINDIEEIFLTAYKLGCKGITVYRYGSREKQLLTKCSECEDNVCSI